MRSAPVTEGGTSATTHLATSLVQLEAVPLTASIRASAPERNEHTPSLTVYPANTLGSELTGPAIDKTHSRFVLTYDGLTS